MENTLENKAKFFSQYLYQEVFCIKGWNRGKMICDPEKLNSEEHKYFKKSFLQLKPLSAISDEDVLYIGNIVFKNVELTQLILTKDGVVNMFDSGWNVSGIKMIEIFDYLRSKGYLVPFNGLSENEILNRGWAVLEKPDNN